MQIRYAAGVSLLPPLLRRYYADATMPPLLFLAIRADATDATLMLRFRQAITVTRAIRFDMLTRRRASTPSFQYIQDDFLYFASIMPRRAMRAVPLICFNHARLHARMGAPTARARTIIRSYDRPTERSPDQNTMMRAATMTRACNADDGSAQARACRVDHR